ncbi:endonuclease/exonuclease/phosphatase family protein [Vibrio hannami]|uniref:endonuclease/exonuclease/phosphatase family protein n=1 Tax=Vibrio hannami TaxID=2717094 RepID=UPI00240F42DB|nr:endonuclease/exonuclease/phosphatase family protein [Vibrio hannami]MDG3086010.1 endonuclease/exonuclease/phosphatase family protein [Vibrio hannami]
MRKAIKIATFNLLNYLEPPNAYYDLENIYTNEQWDKKQGWIADKLREANADIIGFQEVFSPDSLRILSEQCGYPYFTAIDTPEVEKGYLYSKPPLAIASRYPIQSAREVKPDRTLVEHYPLSEPFSFSRMPIHATICVEGVGEIEVINVHLKSQRPIVGNMPTAEDKEDHSQVGAKNFGSWLSTVQRGFETHFLYHYISQLRLSDVRPVVLLGDFNQSLKSLENAVLLSPDEQRTSEDITGMPMLFDSWQQYCKQFGKDKDFLQWSRTPTHYYGAVGNTLDYVLLSGEFDSENSHGHFIVRNYSVIDNHIVNPRHELDRLASDHAIVTVSVEVR